MSPTTMCLAAVLPPSSVVAVIVAVPVPTAVTTPFSSTVATLSSLEEYVTFLLVAFSGKMVGTSLSVSPTLSTVASFGKLMESTFTFN